MTTTLDTKTPGLYLAYGRVYGRFVISEAFNRDAAIAGFKSIAREIEGNLPPMLREQAQ